MRRLRARVSPLYLAVVLRVRPLVARTTARARRQRTRTRTACHVVLPMLLPACVLTRCTCAQVGRTPQRVTAQRAHHDVSHVPLPVLPST
jgi:hypothetical protein